MQLIARRRGRPGRQHPPRLVGQRRLAARRRLRDPHGRGADQHPLHHDGPGPRRRRPGHRGAAIRGDIGVRSLQDWAGDAPTAERDPGGDPTTPCSTTSSPGSTPSAPTSWASGRSGRRRSGDPPLRADGRANAGGRDGAGASRTPSAWPPASTRTPSASTRWPRSASGTSRSAPSPASRSPATPSRGCSGSPPTAPSSTGWASTTTAPRWSRAARRRASSTGATDARRADRPAPRASPVLGVNIGKTKVVPEETRRRPPTTRSAPAARAVRRLPGRQRLLAQHPRAAQPAGRRQARAPARRRTPPGRRRCRPAGAAAGQDRPRPRRRRRRSRSPTWRRASGLDGIIATNTTISRDGLGTDRRARSRRSAPAGCPGRLRRAVAEVLRLLRERVGPGLTLIGVGGITTVDDARSRLAAGADLSRPTPPSSTSGPLWPRRIVGRARDDRVTPAAPTARCTSHGRGGRGQAVGAYRHLTLVAPGIPERFAAGQLPGRLGRRGARSPVGRSGCTGSGPSAAFGAALDVVVEPRGSGTRWLAAQPVGAPRRDHRPAGPARSRCPRRRSPACSWARATPPAPLFPLAERLRERGCAVSLVVSGARRGATCSSRSRRAVRRRSRSSTARRSATRRPPRRGRPLAARPTSSTPPAPPPTLRGRAAAAAARRRAWTRWPLERPLTCGTGLCHGCPLPVVGEDGGTHVVRACADGPVVRGDRVRLGRCSTRWPRVTDWPFANPVMVAVRLRRHRPRARAVRRPWRRSAASSPARSPSTRRAGGPGPRLVEAPSGLVNAVGLPNPGLEHFLGDRAARRWSTWARPSWPASPAHAGGVRRPRPPPRPRARRGRPRGQPVGTRRGRQRALRGPRALPRGQRRRRRADATSPAGVRPAGQAAPRRRPRSSSGAGRATTPAPTPSSSATPCRPPSPTGGRAGSAARPSARSPCAASPTVRHALPGAPGRSAAAASRTSPPPGPTSPPAPAPSRSAPRCSTTRPPAGRTRIAAAPATEEHA